MIMFNFPDQYKMLQRAMANNKKPVGWLVPLGTWLEGGALFGLPIRGRAFVKGWKLLIAIE